MISATSDPSSGRSRSRLWRVCKWLIVPVVLIAAAVLVKYRANSAADRAPGFGQSQQAEDEGSAARMAHRKRPASRFAGSRVVMRTPHSA
jgi:hypothetical protein